MPNVNSKAKRLLLPLFAFFVIVGAVIGPVGVRAQAPSGAVWLPPPTAGMPVVDAGLNAQEVKKEVKDDTSRAVVEAAVATLVNGVSYFTSALAYQAAVALTTSCPGQIVCWDSKSITQGIREAAEGSIGEMVGTIQETANLSELGFNACNPSLNVSLKIQLGLLNQVKPKPRCDFGALAQGWEDIYQSFSTGEVLNKMMPVFTPGSSPLSASLVVFDNAAVARETAEANAAVQRVVDAAAGGGFSDIRDPVSGRIKSPAFVTKAEYEKMDENQKKNANAMVGQYTAGSIATRAVIGVASNTAATFTQTLVAGIWNRLAKGLLSTEELIANQPDLILNPDALLSPSGASGQAVAQAVRNQRAPIRDAGLSDPLLDFSTCPTVNRGPKNCAIDQQFANAVRVADATPLSVREALKQGMLHGDWALISSNDAAKDQDPFCYTYGYCESNLKKLRAARIISIGWEIAASESSSTSPVTLQAVVDGFDDCNAEGIKDDQHPYCKLIDPDWILKAPLAQCRAMGYGEQLIAPEIPTRAEVCLDTQTCLKQDENGNCVGGWGYCTQEQNVWRFNADQCPAQFNTCRVLRSRAGDSRAYNVNTIDHGVCNADNVGCREYATIANVVSCSLPDTQTCSLADGCVCPVRQASCLVSNNESSCTDLATNRVCRLSGLCTVSGGCTCNIDATCRVKQGEHSCVSSSGNDADDGDDWQTSSSRFLTAKAQTCNSSDIGCTQLVRFGLGQSLNIIRNGSFEELEDGDVDGNVDHARFWSPFGNVTNGNQGSLIKDGSKSVSGSSAITLGGTATFAGTSAIPAAVCTLQPSGTVCSSSQGCNCKLSANAEYGCAVPFGGSKCSVTNRIIQDNLQLSRNVTYTLSFAIRPVSGTLAGAEAIIHAYDALHRGFDLTNVVTTTSMSGHVDNANASVECLVPASNPNQGDLRLRLRGNVADPSRPIVGSCTFVMTTQAVSGGSIEFKTFGTNTAYVDNVQLEEGGGTSFHEGYGDTLGNLNVKVAPAYLGCSGEATDMPECANFAGVCRENELGCEAYRPTNGDPMVPGIVNANDLCPSACSGYDVFRQAPTVFDSSTNPVYFIPKTASQCSEADVGCSEFTNVETEGREYYSGLRLCVKPEDPSVGTYYSWEGSDTTGYQLRNWTLKNTTDASGAVSSVANGTSINNAAGNSADVAASGSPAFVGPAPCTKLDVNALHCASRSEGIANGSLEGYCTREDIDNGNLDCREFYDAAGNRHYRLLSKTIIASASCFAYRITTSTEADCGNSNGRWNAASAQCIYNADVGQSQSCSASMNGCRAYKGNASTNVRTVFSDDFESNVTDRWQDSDDNGSSNLSQSAEAIVVGGHSLKIGGTGGGRQMSVEVRGLVAPQRSYTVTFWARGLGKAQVMFRDGRATLPPTAGPTPEFITGGVALSPEWRQYSVGPVIVDQPADWGTGSTRFVIQAAGICPSGANRGARCVQNSDCGGSVICAQSDVYIDNVQLKEVQDSIYVVRNSWNTPVSCDSTAAGAPSPQEMLGCKEYKKSDNSSSFLRSFSRLCREKAIGCAAYSNTQNTPDVIGAQTFNAVCTLATRCDGANGASCQCNYDLQHQAIQAGAPQVLADVCRVAVGETSCRFTYNGVDYSSRPDQHPDRVVVPSDKRTYLVVKQANLCGVGAIGCSAFGNQQQAFETKCYNRVGGNVAKCDAKRCTVSGNVCSNNAGCAGGATDICAPSTCTCALDVPGSGRATCNVEFSSDSCTASFEKPIISKWNTVALRDIPSQYDTILCKAEAERCDAFSTTDGVQYFKDPGNRVCEYQQGVSYNGETRNGWFRKSEAGGLFPCYPELLRGGTDFEIYKNADQSCTLATICTEAGGCNCPAAGAPVCRVVNGGTTCGYQGWVGACQPEFDRCEEFIDPNQTTATNPEGKPYYYLVNEKLDRQSCAGSGSLKQGCVLFNQTSVTAKLYSAATTYYKSKRDAQNGRVNPVNCNLNPKDPACNSRCTSIPGGTCAIDKSFDCRNDSECRRCDNNTALICASDADCPSGGRCGGGGACNGTPHYTSACQNALDCNAGNGEICKTSVSGNRLPTNVITNDSNVIIKVNPDRQCAEWLSCSSFETVWDDQRGQYRNICSGFGPCTENRQVGSAFECTKPVPQPLKLFSDEEYSKRDTSWGGTDYSGFTVPNRFSPSFLQPISIVTGRCVTAGGDNILTGDGRYNFCSVASECNAVGGADAVCTPLSGICVDAGGRTGNSCDTNGDCCRLDGSGNCSDNAYCGYSYAAKHRFGVVLEPSRSCSSDAECTIGRTGLQYDGSCQQHRCAYNYEGGKFSTLDKNLAPRCRAYPESDSPFPSSIVQTEGGSLGTGGYDNYGQVSAILGPYQGANTCGRANDCACTYQRLEYGTAKAYTRFYSPRGATRNGAVTFDGNTQLQVPTANAYEADGICIGGTNEGRQCNALDSSSDECGSGDGGRCMPLSEVRTLQGWQGFCMDPDKSMNIAGDPSAYECNLWLPVDRLAGIPDEYNQFEEAGFRPTQASLAYCQVAKGTAQADGSYAELFHDESQLSQNGPCYGAPIVESADGTNPPLDACAQAAGTSLSNCQARMPCDDADEVCIEDRRKFCWADAASAQNCPATCNRDPVPPEPGGRYFRIDGDDFARRTDTSVLADNVYRSDLAGISFEVERNNGDHAVFFLRPSDSTDGDFRNAVMWSNNSGKGIKGGTFVPFDDILADKLTTADPLWNFPGDVGNDDNRCLKLLDSGGQSVCRGLGGDRNCLGAKAVFDGSGRLQSIVTVLCHNSSVSYHTVRTFAAKYLYREQCINVSQVHNVNGGIQPNFAWTDRIWRARNGNTSVTSAAGVGYAVFSSRPGLNEQQADLTPFGHIGPDGLFLTDGIDSRYPLAVYESEGGSPFTFVTQVPVVTGASPDTYSGPGQRRNGDPLYDVAGHPFACVGPCNGPNSNMQGTAESIGEDRLSSLFVKNFLNMQWDGSSYQTQNEGYDNRERFASSGHAPVILPVISIGAGACAGGATDGLCTEGPSEGLSVNQNPGTQPVIFQGGRGKATIQFYAYADPNRMPIRRKIVDFGDGTPPTELSGAYKNHRGCANNRGEDCSAAIQLCGNGSDWGHDNQACDPHYFQETHTYVCRPDMLQSPGTPGALPACSGDRVYPCQAAGACRFRPRVQLMDNWGFCNGTCPGAPGGASCFNKGDGQAVGSSDPLHIDKPGDAFETSSSFANECRDLQGEPGGRRDPADSQRPWTAFGNEIIVELDK